MEKASIPCLAESSALQRLQPVGAAGHEREVVALGGVGPRERLADAGRGAGDQGELARNVHHGGTFQRFGGKVKR